MLNKNLNPAAAFSFFCSLCLVSVLFSPFLLSISMWGLCFVALWNSIETLPKNNPFFLRLLSALSQSLTNLKRAWPFLALTLLFWVVLCSGFFSESKPFWLERLRVRVPFLILPWAFANAPDLSKRQFFFPLKLLIWVLVATSLAIVGYYFLHKTEIVQGLEEGRSIPVPRSNHIRYSLMVVVAFMCGIYLSIFSKKAKYRVAYGLSALFFFVFLHFLAVRSGLLALYVVLLCSALALLFYQKNKLFKVALLVALPLVLFGAWQLAPNLAQRIHYMTWEIHEFSQGRGVGGSDAGRMASYAVGYALFKEHPLFGTTMGDFEAQMQAKTAELYPQHSETFKLPHNQYLYILASTGLVGLLLSIFAFFTAFFQKKYKRSFLFLCFFWLAQSSFLAEYTLETSAGVAFYLFFSLFFLRYGEVQNLEWII